MFSAIIYRRAIIGVHSGQLNECGLAPGGCQCVVQAALELWVQQ